MIEKLTLTQISSTDRKKDGTECLTKQGKRFWKVGLKTKEHGDEWMNGLVFKEVEWKEGDVVELDTKMEEYNGKESLKFRVPKKEEKALADKDAEIAALKAKLEKKEDVPEITPEPVPEDEINPDDIPL